MENIEQVLEESELFFNVDDERAKELSEELSEHMNNKLYYNPTPLESNKGVTFSGNYSTKNLRQSFFSDCIFSDANYADASLAGSTFKSSQFEECNYLNTNFQSCDFRECTFSNITKGLNYTRFNKSVFSDTDFINCYFSGVLMNDVIFNNCKFIDCQWSPVAIENAIFRNTSLHSVKFRSMNFEFSTFDHVSLDDITLPFPTIPYIFNGLSYLKNATGNIRVTSATKRGGITVAEYFELLDKLAEFYKYTKNYFPLANILISRDMHKEAFASIVNGINVSLTLRRFRMLRNYCKQLNYVKNISAHDRQALYRYILNKAASVDLKKFEYENLNIYLPEVRQLLLNEVGKQKLEISIFTDIDHNSSGKLSLMIDIIKDLLEEKCDYSIELRHNSPWEFFISVFSNPDNVKMIVNSMLFVFSAIQTGIVVEEYMQNRKKLQKENIQTDISISGPNIAIHADNIHITNNIYTINDSIMKSE